MTTSHTIALGTLVEVNLDYSEHHGIRAFVVKHTRDCDGTPLYGLGISDDLSDYEEIVLGGDGSGTIAHEIVKNINATIRSKVANGFSDDCLKIIRPPKDQ